MTEIVYERLPSGNPRHAMAEIRGWNWGAFLLNWIWALAHNQPVLGGIILLGFCLDTGFFAAVVLSIYLGIRGNELAWESRSFASVEEFRLSQRLWLIWGVAVWLVILIVSITAWMAIRHLLEVFFFGPLRQSLEQGLGGL